MNQLPTSVPFDDQEVSPITRATEPPAETRSDATAQLDSAIDAAVGALKDSQAANGHFVFPLEADATIPAEYILLEHFLDDIDPEVEARLGAYLRTTQGADGGWPLYTGGQADVSASVKAYYALKLLGDDTETPHMRRARDRILAMGGAARANVFTRVALALFGQVPWRAVPAMPVEITLLPRWLPFHLGKVSYWSRTVMVPLLVLMALKPKARNPRGVDIAELFVTPPWQERHYMVNPTGKLLGRTFLLLDRAVRAVEPLFFRTARRRAIARAMAFVEKRLNGQDGLGGIFPAMANAVMAFDALGVDRTDARMRTGLDAIRRLVVIANGTAYCQPCLSPVWDTALSMLALMEADEPIDGDVIRRAGGWLALVQVLEVRGDWADARPELRPGGWAFQFANDYYPDTDDSAAVLMALHRAGWSVDDDVIARGIEWVLGMQSRNGGWGAFDADNTYTYLNHIPFADHGALLDPPTADVTARCVGMLAQCGLAGDHPALARGLAFLRAEQEDDGSWFGRWGTNYVYGTWSVLSAFNAAGEDMTAAHIRRAVAWLTARQRADGGWGEDCASYWPDREAPAKQSTPSQTSWALLALMAAGEVDSPAVARGIGYLLNAPRHGGIWRDELHNAVGFPRVFFLKYHGYAHYFPLWALARYRNLKQSNRRTPAHGI